MNNKGIAINTILLLVVGVIVVGVIVYLVFRFAFGPTFSIQECKIKMIQYCTLCKNLDWPKKKLPDGSDNPAHLPKPDDLKKCGEDHRNEFYYWFGDFYDNCYVLQKYGCEPLGVT